MKGASARNFILATRPHFFGVAFVVALFVRTDFAFATFCAHGSADGTACTCQCADPYIWNGWNDCYCDYTKAGCQSAFQWADQNNNCECKCAYSSTDSQGWVQSFCASAGATWDVTDCNCRCLSDQQTWDRNTFTCKCNSTCESPLVQDGDCTCICPTDGQATCEGTGGTFNADSCSCGCPENMHDTGLKCFCNDVQCEAPLVQNETSCGCECPASAGTRCTETGGKFDMSSCSCDCGAKIDDGSGGCQCGDVPSTYNPITETWDTTKCITVCKTGYVSYAGDCVETHCATSTCRYYIDKGDGSCNGCPK